MAPRKSPSEGNDKMSVVKAPMKKQQSQSPGLSYFLFLHQEELKKRKASLVGTSLTKFHLTNELITKTVENIHKCSSEDLRILSREKTFKKYLKRRIARKQQDNVVEMAAYQRRQHEKFKLKRQKALEELQQQQQTSAEEPQQDKDEDGIITPEKCE